MEKLFVIVCLFITSCLTFAQNNTDPIRVYQEQGTVFMQNDIRLKPDQLLDVTEFNMEAFMEMEKAKNYYDVETRLIASPASD